MRGSYGAVSGFYDGLARTVFANRIYRAQLFLLQAIPPGAKILIVGGGTGWILEEIARLHRSGLHITYVEISARMLALSKKRNAGANKVHFIHGPIQNILLNDFYDIVFTPFVFDNFSDETLARVFHKLDRQLKSGGHWLFADFQLQEKKLSQKILLNIMYLFFRISCKVEAFRLPDSAGTFHQYGYRKIHAKAFYRGFIYAVIFQK